jgi:DNA-binding transcriptional MerR regulator
MKKALDVYLIGEAASIVGVSVQALRWWEHRGLLRPSIAGPPRRPAQTRRGRPPGATDRLYARDDLLVAVVIRRLRLHGFSLQKIRKATGALRARFGEDPLRQALAGKFRLLVGASIVTLEDGDKRAFDVLRNHQGVAMFALEREARTLEELIGEWRRSKEQEKRLAEALARARLNFRQVRRPAALVEASTTEA